MLIQHVRNILSVVINKSVKLYDDITFFHKDVEKEYRNQEIQTEIVCAEAYNYYGITHNTLWLYKNIPMLIKHELLAQICEEELNSDRNCFFHPNTSFFNQKENSFVETCSLCRDVSHGAPKCQVYKGIKSDIPCHLCYEQGIIAYHNSYHCKGVSYNYLKNEQKEQIILKKLAKSKIKFIQLHRYHLEGLRERHNESN